MTGHHTALNCLSYSVAWFTPTFLKGFFFPIEAEWTIKRCKTTSKERLFTKIWGQTRWAHGTTGSINLRFRGSRLGRSWFPIISTREREEKPWNDWLACLGQQQRKTNHEPIPTRARSTIRKERNPLSQQGIRTTITWHEHHQKSWTSVHPTAITKSPCRSRLFLQYFLFY